MKILITLLFTGITLAVGSQTLTRINGLFCLENGTPFTGHYTTYYPHGGKAAQYGIKNGKLHNNVIVYRENGSIDYTGQYFEGAKDGLWCGRNQKGEVTTQIRYKKGKKVGEWIIGDHFSEQVHLLYFANDHLLSSRSVTKKQAPMLSRH
jgi:antitoxin component YwqK of YwqJK toxin-antitoxin module